MAEGVRDRLGADLGLSVTGVAGPTGGTPEKPVGLVYLGLATAHGRRVPPARHRPRTAPRHHPAAVGQAGAELGAVVAHGVAGTDLS